MREMRLLTDEQQKELNQELIDEKEADYFLRRFEFQQTGQIGEGEFTWSDY